MSTSPVQRSGLDELAQTATQALQVLNDPNSNSLDSRFSQNNATTYPPEYDSEHEEQYFHPPQDYYYPHWLNPYWRVPYYYPPHPNWSGVSHLSTNVQQQREEVRALPRMQQNLYTSEALNDSNSNSLGSRFSPNNATTDTAEHEEQYFHPPQDHYYPHRLNPSWSDVSHLSTNIQQEREEVRALPRMQQNPDTSEALNDLNSNSLGSRFSQNNPTKSPSQKKNRIACTWPNCGKTYSTTTNRNKHISNYHLGEKFYTCNVSRCWKEFATQTELDIHLYSHFGLRPYKCPAAGCTRAFNNRGALTRHQKVHPKSLRVTVQPLSKNSSLKPSQNKKRHKP